MCLCPNPKGRLLKAIGVSGALAIVLAAGVAPPAGAQSPGGGPPGLVARAMSDPTAWTLVESLTTEVGARPLGSPKMALARDWGVRKLTELGFKNVHVESFQTGVWRRGPESAEVTAPFQQPLHILGLGNSTPTPAGGITAPIALFKAYRELLAQPVGAVRGKIVVVTQVMQRTQDGSGYGAINEQRVKGPSEAAKRGAIAYLVRSISTADTRLPHTGLALPAGIPAAALSTPDAELIEHMAERGGPVVIHLELASTVGETTSWNVVGEIPGTQRADEVVLVGGHLDSWDPGTGAIDDGAGVAIMAAAARLAGDRPPLRTIRVVMWGSEEQTGSGAAYAKAHAAELPRIIVGGESDLGADRIWKISLPKGAWTTDAMQSFGFAVRNLRINLSDAPAAFSGSDLEDLAAAGLPFVEFSQDASRYFDIHHSADDTLDKIDRTQLAQNVAVWASFIHAAANSAVDFRRPISEPSDRRAGG